MVLPAWALRFHFDRTPLAGSQLGFALAVLLNFGCRLHPLGLAILAVNSVVRIFLETYLLEHGHTLVDTDDLGHGLHEVSSLRMVNELLHLGRVVSQLVWKVHSLHDCFCVGGKAGLAVGQAENVFGFDILDVALVAYLFQN